MSTKSAGFSRATLSFTPDMPRHAHQAIASLAVNALTTQKGPAFMFATDQILTLDSNRAVWREVGNEVIVLDVPTATYLNLNGSARVLWKRLDAGATAVELAAELVAAYAIDEERAATDVEGFLEALQERSLLSNVG